MGYDMLNRARLDELERIERRGGDVWREWFANPGNYLRRGIGGQPRLRAALLGVGMAFDVADYGLAAPNAWAGGAGRVRWPSRARSSTR